MPNDEDHSPRSANAVRSEWNGHWSARAITGKDLADSQRLWQLLPTAVLDALPLELASVVLPAARLDELGHASSGGTLHTGHMLARSVRPIRASTTLASI
jgi:hypothetical protein